MKPERNPKDTPNDTLKKATWMFEVPANTMQNERFFRLQEHPALLPQSSKSSSWRVHLPWRPCNGTKTMGICRSEAKPWEFPYCQLDVNPKVVFFRWFWTGACIVIMVEVYPRHRQRPSFRLGTLVDWSTGVQPQIWINHWASKLDSSSPKIKDERWTPGFFTSSKHLWASLFWRYPVAHGFTCPINGMLEWIPAHWIMANGHWLVQLRSAIHFIWSKYG